MHYKKLFFSLFLLITVNLLQAEVPELEKYIPDASEYSLICSFNPLTYNQKGYLVDNLVSLTGTLKRIGYFLTVTDRQDNRHWIFAAMDPFTDDIALTGIPEGDSPFQTKVRNLEVISNSSTVDVGKFPEGNIEFWSYNYNGRNSMKLPGATDAFDFSDTHAGGGDGYGSMQIHNFMKKQTVLAFNHFYQGQRCDLGIGNAPKGSKDWTFSQNGKNFKDALLMVVGKIENPVMRKITKINPLKTSFQVTTDKVSYKPNEEMTFTCKLDIQDQPAPTLPYYIEWQRTGDDGKSEKRKDLFVPGQELKYTTSIAQPGFVRVIVRLLDQRGVVPHSTWNFPMVMNCGAGADINFLEPAAKEPEDFDEFWKKQKARLAEVPLKYTMNKVKSIRNCDIYAVSVDCAGPRPVTGYLCMPRNAKAKSLPAAAEYHGYGTYIQKPLTWAADNKIYFNINAHGIDLGKDAEYYRNFFQGIRSNGKIYAFDPKQNADPETAYFNGMALRVMRSLEFLKALPQWNGKDLSVSGGSQGGLQTIWAAALDPDVTFANSMITWCCDMNGTAAGRLNGWRPPYVPALAYYDAVFHARRISCNIVIGRAGLGDYTCPPSGLAILYNNIASPNKQINWYQGSTHGFVPKKPQIFKISPEK